VANFFRTFFRPWAAFKNRTPEGKELVVATFITSTTVMFTTGISVANVRNNQPPAVEKSTQQRLPPQENVNPVLPAGKKVEK